MRSPIAGVWLAWIPFLTACNATVSEAPVSRIRSALVYAEPSPAGTLDDAVLLLRTTMDGQELLCSATLVAENLALTARHCLAHLIQGPFNCTVRGELIDNPDGAGQIGLDLPADSLDFYGGAVPRGEPVATGVSIFSTLSATICVNDIALVVLDRAVALPIAPIRLESRARIGESVIVVGYGMDETRPQTIDFRTQPRLRKTGLTIGGVGPDSLDQGVTTVAPRTIVIEGPSACEGDSGGPLFDAKTNAIVGVYSLLDGDSCVDSNLRNLFVHIPPFRPIIDEAFRAAGTAPTPEVRSEEPDAASEAGVRADTGPPSSVSPAPLADEGCAIAPANERLGEAFGSFWAVLLLATGFRRAGTPRRKFATAARATVSAALRADHRSRDAQRAASHPREPKSPLSEPCQAQKSRSSELSP